MADTEEYFPRGGKKPSTTYFKRSANFLGAPEKQDKKKKKLKKKPEGDDGYLSDEGTKEVNESFKNCAYGLSYKTIKEGVLILGRVKNIQETKVMISLPCRIVGSVMACHISEPYNKQLQAYIDDKVDQVTDLWKMFRVGQYVAVKVLEVKELSIMLSMMPQHVNGQKKQTELNKGTLLQTAVASVEDHGYVMDIGVPDTRAFLPKKNANPEMELDVGIITWCVVKSLSDGGVVTLSNELATLQNSYQKHKTNSPVLPASALEFLVDSPLDNGIEGTVFGDTTAYIQRQHADHVKGKKPALGQKIRARLLYVMPTRNTPFLTLKNIFDSTFPDLEKEQKLKDGEIIDNAKVLKITGRSIHFRLADNCFGTMSLKRIHVDEDLTDEEVVAKSYPLGSTHKVRVLCYHLADYVYPVSDQPAVVTEKYFGLDQLSVGELVNASVKSVSDSHVVLSVGRLSGYVSQTHLSDTGVFLDPKNSSISKLPKKKYKVGQAVTARVLVVDPVKQTLFLTLKPSLLVQDLEILESYERVDIGKAYTGVIKTVKSDFVLVSFFNNVIAYVPRNYVAKEPLTNIGEAFHIGQIVNCTILRVEPENRKMTGSLTTVPFWPAKKRDLTLKRKQSFNNEVSPKKPKIEENSEVKTKLSESTDNEIKEKHKKRKGEEQKNESKCDEKLEINEKKQKRKSKEPEPSLVQTEITEKGNKKKKKSKLEKDTAVEVTANSKKEKKYKKLKPESQEVIEHKRKSDKETVSEVIDIGKNKNKKQKLQSEDFNESNTESEKKNKKSKEKDNNIVSEESDAIETDIYDDSDEVLSPQELGLVDFSDCVTAKHFKKRVASLIKSVKNRTRRLDKIDKKISRIEEKGLTLENKKFHTAMHKEKLIVQKRTQQLLEALSIAQENLKKFDITDEVDYKKKKKDIKKEDGETKSVKIEKKPAKDTSVHKPIEIKVVEKMEPALDVAGVKDFWSATDANMKNVQEDSSSSEDEVEEQPKKKRKKLTIEEKVAKVRAEEERVRQLEQRALESGSQPQTVDEHERAVLANPESSELWLSYISFHLQAAELEKARCVGRKALQNISYRNEDDRLNVCLALLNAENLFGTKESLQKALEEAVQTNDPFKVHSKVLDMYVRTSKHQELSALVDLMMRKYKRDSNTYIQCGAACFKLDLLDKARQVMQKGITVLEKKEHVTVLVQFALLESKYGGRERAEALFEQVLTVYPQRVDVTSTYVDMLLKGGDVDNVRQVMERMTALKLPARKMKILYKKWVEVEEKIGTQEQVESVKQRALQYIEKAKF